MLTIEQIEKEWAVDCKIDKTDLNTDSANQLELHKKYHKILNWIRKQLRIAQTDRIRMVHLKNDYYSNNMPPQQLKELNWKPNPRLVIKNDLDRYIEADEEMIALNLKIGDLNDMLQFVESILKSIYQKPFITKNIIENNRFINGII